MMRFVPLALALVILAAIGVYDVVTAAHYADLQSSGSVQAKLDTIPMKVGDWTAETQPFNEKMLKATNAIAHTYRRYTRRGAKPAMVDVLILAGEPGEMGAHDPERCYGGTGYRKLTNRIRKTAADVGVQHSIWSQKFTQEKFPPVSIEVAWGWTPDGHWQAAEDARYDYAGRTILYKVYFSRTLGENETDAIDPIGELLTELAPLARPVLANSQP